MTNHLSLSSYVLLINSLWRSRQTVLAVDLKCNQLVDIGFTTKDVVNQSCSVLDSHGIYLFLAHEQPNTIPQATIGIIGRDSKNDNLTINHSFISLPALQASADKTISKNVEWRGIGLSRKIC